MATLRSFMLALSASDNGGSVISPENRDPLFRITLKTLEFQERWSAQKGSPAKRTGHTLLVAAQYSQKSPENNALFAIWLGDFPNRIRPGSAAVGLLGGRHP